MGGERGQPHLLPPATGERAPRHARAAWSVWNVRPNVAESGRRERGGGAREGGGGASAPFLTPPPPLFHPLPPSSRSKDTGEDVAVKLIKRPLPKIILPNILREIRVR